MPEVWVQASTNFARGYYDYYIEPTDIKLKLLIEDEDMEYSYSSYINLAEEKWTSIFFLDAYGKPLARYEWSYKNTIFNQTAKQARDKAKNQAVVMDPYSKVVINDLSSSMTDFVRDYSITVNDTFTVKDFVEVKSHSSLDQTLKFIDDTGALTWVTSQLEYKGNAWL